MQQGPPAAPAAGELVEPLSNVARVDPEGGFKLVSPQPPAALPAAPEPSAPPEPKADLHKWWTATVSVDPDLRKTGKADPDAPNHPIRTFTIARPQIFIGRHYGQITVDDPAMSETHVLIRFDHKSACLTVEDLGTTNGTVLCRKDGTAEPVNFGAPLTIRDGDQLEIGRWTRITFALVQEM